MSEVKCFYCDYYNTEPVCIPNFIKWKDYPHPFYYLIEDMKKSNLFSVPSDLVWENRDRS